MQPPNFNRIRKYLFSDKNVDSQKLIFQAVTRMAFERDPDLLITVTHLDYYSLDKYHGHLTFADGLTKIDFKGNRIVTEQDKLQQKQKQSNSQCFNFFMEKRFNLENINITHKISDVVSIKTIMGVMVGPHSATFKEYLRR